MKRIHINRRTMLKGLGSVAIGFPLLEEMIAANALGAIKTEVPVRAFNVFSDSAFHRRCKRRDFRTCSSLSNR